MTVVADGADVSFRVLPDKHHAGRCGFLVGSDGDEGLLVATDGEDRTRLGADSLGMQAENVTHTLFHGLGAFLAFILKILQVADHDDSLQVGTIPVVEEIDNGLTLEVHDDLFLAYRHTVGIQRALENDGESLLAHTVAVPHAAAPLFVDDAALALDFLLVEQDVAGPAVENLNTHLDHLGVAGGHIDVVNGLVEAGVGIDAAAELDAMLLKLFNHLVVGVALDSVEGHVLAEVREALLVVALEDGAGVRHEAELDAVLGLLVVADVVGESVVEVAYDDFLVDRHSSRQVSRFCILFAAYADLGE